MQMKICTVSELNEIPYTVDEGESFCWNDEILSADTTLPAHNIRTQSVPILRGTLPYLTI